MASSDLFPDPDLLQKIDGIEAGLRKGKKLGLVGWVGLLASASQIPLIIARSDGLASIGDLFRGDLLDRWPLLLLAAIAIASFIIVVRTRFLIKESREPFRYTYSVGEFNSVDDQAGSIREIRAWLPHDISQRLNDRIRRLSPLDESSMSDRLPDSHIRIAGEYVLREGEDIDTLEVLPRIHIGPLGKDADTLAHRVRFEIPHVESPPSSAVIADTAPGPETVPAYDRPEGEGGETEGENEDLTTDEFDGDETFGELEEEGDGFDEFIEGEPIDALRLSRDEYQLVLERVYFSVASEIYRQIRRDVQKRIDLLPGKRYKAAAYLHEAEDYAESNTLDAYDAAQDLYRSSMEIYVPRPRPLASGLVRRTSQRTGRGLRGARRRIRSGMARLVPALARRDVMTARAAMGYANMLVYRRIMAGLSGREVEAIFRARPAARDAIALVRGLPSRYPNHVELLFGSLVTLALVQAFAGPLRASESTLKEACALSPARAERDPRYLFVAAVIEPSLAASIPSLRRAVDLDPRSEVARFALALRMEMMWRRRPTLEVTEAEIVIEQYEKVIDLNPGNIQAWAHVGYMRWLMGDLEESRKRFRRGRDYKEIKPDTFVALLDYGAARIEAESGDIAEAYRLYSAARIAHLSQGMSHDPENSALFYFFNPATDPVIKRFTDFRSKVADQCRSADELIPRRVRDAVMSCATSEFGEACHNTFLRTGDDSYLKKAQQAYEKAVKLDPSNVIADYNLCTVKLRESEVATEEGHRLAAIAERRLSREGALVAPDRDVGLLLRERSNELLTQSDRLVEDAVTHAMQIKEVEPAWAAAKLLLIAAKARSAAIAKRAMPRYERLAEDARLRRSALQQAAGSGERSLQTRKRAVYDRQGNGRAVAGAVELTVQVLDPKRLERDLRDADESATRYEKQVETLRSKTRDAIGEVWSELHDLLPHGWMWLKDTGEIDWSTIRTRDPALENRWSEDLDDLHAKALVTWARANVLLEKGGGAEPNLAELLVHLHRQLLPDDMDLLLAYRDAGHPADIPKPTRRRPKGRSPLPELDVDGAIKFLIGWRQRSEPDSYRTLTQLADRAFTDADRISALERMKAAATSSALRAHITARLNVARRERGVALWKSGKYTDATDEFRNMTVDDDNAPLWWRTDLVDELLGDLSGVPDTDAFDHLRSWLEDASSSAPTTRVRVDSTNASLSVVRRKYEMLGRGIAARAVLDESQSDPLTTPFALEIAPGFFGKDAEDPVLLSLTREELPAMVVALGAELGIDIPAVTVRVRDDLPPRSHQVLIKDVLVSSGQAPPDGWFCDERGACLKLGLTPVAQTEQPHGLWLGEEDGDRAREVGLDVVDVAGFLRRHVEGVARMHAPVFVDFQWVQDRLRRWANGDPRWLRWLAGDFARPVNRAIVTRSLRMLCEQGIPLTDLTSVVEEIDAQLETLPSEPDIHEAAERVTIAVRGAMKDLLPGNHPGNVRVRMPARVERSIARHVVVDGGTRYLMLPPAEIESLKHQIQAAVQDLEEAVIVVREADQWAIVQRFLREHMPALRSMSEDEILQEVTEMTRSNALVGVSL